jgi:SUMO ligase MMS21 Smc5/6 complex component
MSHHLDVARKPPEVVSGFTSWAGVPYNTHFCSSTCGHAFSGEAIRDYLKRCPPSGKSCPAAGCSQKLTIVMMVADSGLEKRVRLAARRAQRDEDNSDADDNDEVIE